MARENMEGEYQGLMHETVTYLQSIEQTEAVRQAMDDLQSTGNMDKARAVLGERLESLTNDQEAEKVKALLMGWNNFDSESK